MMTPRKILIPLAKAKAQGKQADIVYTCDSPEEAQLVKDLLDGMVKLEFSGKKLPTTKISIDGTKVILPLELQQPCRQLNYLINDKNDKFFKAPIKTKQDVENLCRLVKAERVKKQQEKKREAIKKLIEELEENTKELTEHRRKSMDGNTNKLLWLPVQIQRGDFLNLTYILDWMDGGYFDEKIEKPSIKLDRSQDVRQAMLDIVLQKLNVTEDDVDPILDQHISDMKQKEEYELVKRCFFSSHKEHPPLIENVKSAVQKKLQLDPQNKSSLYILTHKTPQMAAKKVVFSFEKKEDALKFLNLPENKKSELTYNKISSLYTKNNVELPKLCYGVSLTAEQFMRLTVSLKEDMGVKEEALPKELHQMWILTQKLVEAEKTNRNVLALSREKLFEKYDKLTISSSEKLALLLKDIKSNPRYHDDPIEFTNILVLCYLVKISMIDFLKEYNKGYPIKDILEKEDAFFEPLKYLPDDKETSDAYFAILNKKEWSISSIFSGLQTLDEKKWPIVLKVLKDQSIKCSSADFIKELKKLDLDKQVAVFKLIDSKELNILDIIKEWDADSLGDVLNRLGKIDHKLIYANLKNIGVEQLKKILPDTETFYKFLKAYNKDDEIDFDSLGVLYELGIFAAMKDWDAGNLGNLINRASKQKTYENLKKIGVEQLKKILPDKKSLTLFKAAFKHRLDEAEDYAIHALDKLGIISTIKDLDSAFLAKVSFSIMKLCYKKFNMSTIEEIKKSLERITPDKLKEIIPNAETALNFLRECGNLSGNLRDTTVCCLHELGVFGAIKDWEADSLGYLCNFLGQTDSKTIDMIDEYLDLKEIDVKELREGLPVYAQLENNLKNIGVEQLKKILPDNKSLTLFEKKLKGEDSSEELTIIALYKLGIISAIKDLDSAHKEKLAGLIIGEIRASLTSEWNLSTKGSWGYFFSKQPTQLGIIEKILKSNPTKEESKEIRKIFKNLDIPLHDSNEWLYIEDGDPEKLYLTDEERLLAINKSLKTRGESTSRHPDVEKFYLKILELTSLYEQKQSVQKDIENKSTKNNI